MRPRRRGRKKSRRDAGMIMKVDGDCTTIASGRAGGESRRSAMALNSHMKVNIR